MDIAKVENRGHSQIIRIPKKFRLKTSQVTISRKGGKIIVNTQEIDPMPVITGAAEYPVNVLEELKGRGFDIDDFDALTPAMEAGSAKAVNIVLMGHFAKHTDIAKEKWIAALQKVVKPQFIELNLKAFDFGYNS